MRPPQGDRGVTLMELMVTMTITVIAGTMALTMFLTTNQTTNASIDANISGASARALLDSWVGLLQVATVPGQNSPQNNTYNSGGLQGQAIASLDSTHLTFYTNLANLPTPAAGVALATPSPATLITVELVSSGTSNCAAQTGYGCLVETHYQTADPTQPQVTPQPQVTRNLLTNVVAGADSAMSTCGGAVAQTSLFTACDANAHPINYPDVTTTANLKSGSSSPTPPKSIVIAFTVTNTDSDGSKHVQGFVSAAALTNTVTT